MLQLRARKVNNYNLYANHAWYVPGVGGMFALLGWFLVGNLLASLLVAVCGFFVPQSVMQDYSMLVAYPLSFIPPMLYAAGKSQKNSLFETGYQLNSSHFGPFSTWQIVLITVLLTFATMISADYINYLNFKLTTSTPGMKEFYDKVVELSAEDRAELARAPFDIRHATNAAPPPRNPRRETDIAASSPLSCSTSPCRSRPWRRSR